LGKFNIGGRQFTAVPCELGEDHGQMCFDKAQIKLSHILKPGTRDFRDTVRHEMVHAAFAMAGLDHVLKDGQEEAVVRCLENIFFPAWDGVPKELRELTAGNK